MRIRDTEFVAIPPDHVFDTYAPYTFVSVDGGVIDNAPLELARRYLAGGAALDADGAKADQAVLLIAPFPNFAQTSAGRRQRYPASMF